MFLARISCGKNIYEFGFIIIPWVLTKLNCKLYQFNRFKLNDTAFYVQCTYYIDGPVIYIFYIV